jgi:hypothetical protein
VGSTIQPRARGGSSLRDELKANRRDREQIRRQRVEAPKPAAPVATGGLVGNAEAASSTYTADAFGLVFTGWSFTAHDYWPGDGAPSLVASGVDEFDPSAEGWYIAQVQVTVYVSGAVPAFARIEVNGDSTANTDASVTDVRGFLASHDRATVTTGPFYHPGAGNGNHYLGARLSWPNTPGVAIDSANASYILSRIS